MAIRIVQIEIQAQGNQYETTVKRITEQNRRLYGEAQAGAAQAAQQMRVWQTSIEGIGRALGALGLAAAALKAINFIGQFSEFAEQLNAVSKRTGVAVEDLHALERAAKADEASFEELSTAFRFLNKAISEARDPTSEQAKLFKALGVNAGETLPTFLQLADRMKNNLDTSDRFRVAQDLLGRSSENLINFMTRGSEAIRESMDAMKATGVVTTEAAERADELRDRWQELKDTIGVNIFLPALRGLDFLIDKLQTAAAVVKSGGFLPFAQAEANRRAGEGLNALAASSLAALEEQGTGKRINLGDLGKGAEKAAEKAQQAAERFADSLKKQNEQLALQIIGLRDGDAAVDAWKQQLLEADAATFKLTNTQKLQIARHGELLASLRELKQEEERRKELTQQLIALGEAEEKQRDQEKQDIRELIQARVEYNQKRRDLDVELLRAAGAPEQVILQREIENRAKQIKELEEAARTNPALLGQVNDLIDRQQVAELQLLRLRDTSIDVAGEVSRTVTDITTAVIQGTLKWADIGRSILASFARLALEQFTSFLQLAQQSARASQLLAAAVIQNPNTTFSIAGPGQGFPQVPFAGGAGVSPVGSLLSSLGSIFNQSSTLGGFFPGGISLGGLAGAGFGGFGFGRLVGANTGGQIGSTIGSIGGSLFGATAIGAAATSSITSTLSSVLGTTIGGLIGGMVIPFVGALIGLIIGQIFGNQKSNPTAITSAAFSGINFNELTSQFDPGNISVGFNKDGLKRSAASQVANEVQTILAEQAQRWTDILNIFPDVIKKEMIPALESTNSALNSAFARLKFSEGGSRSIRQELDALRFTQNAPSTFLNAFLPAIQQGVISSLGQAGITVGPGISGGFGQVWIREQFDALVEALSGLADLSGQLATIPGGANKFLTARDLAGLGDQFTTLLSISNPDTFAKAFDQVKENIQPVIDFLNNSLSQSADIFGRGLVAAMEAATESDARLAFLNSLGTGIKDIVFQGLTQAFIASANYSDLLAPIQQTIRQFTQTAIATGVPPDALAFRSTIIPQVEEIVTRANLLTPLVDILQEFGFDLRSRLNLIPPEPVAEPAPAPEPVAPAAPSQVVVNLYGVSTVDTGSIPELARKINSLLEPLLAPKVG